jgi:hypothetical protein
LLIQTVDQKRCATCERWCGEREPVGQPGTVAIAGETIAGLCIGGGWDGSERRARSTCGHWQVWVALEPAGARALP